MAEDDDDDGFGDFTFASFNPSTINSHPQTHQSSGLKSPITTTVKDNGDDDDEWGDFVETPLGSFTSSNNTPSKASSVDPFQFFFQNQNPTAQLEKSESKNSTRGEIEPTWEQKKENQNQNGWVKLKGAIPLSIFGDIEEEEEEEEEEEVGRSGPSDPPHIDGKDLNFNKKVDNGSDRLKSNGSLGVPFNYDAITSLYNQQVSTNDNGTGILMKGLNLDAKKVDISNKDSNLELSGLNSIAVSMHKRSDSDSVMNLSSQTLQRKDAVNASSNGMSTNIDALDLDFSGWNTDFNANSNMNFDIMKTLNGHSLQTSDEISNSQFNSNGIGFDMTSANYSLFDGLNLKSDVMESKLFSSNLNDGVDIASNSNGRSEEIGGSERDDDDDDEWEFKDAHAPSHVSQGNEKVII